MDSKSNFIQSNFNELFNNLKSNVKIFEILSKKTDYDKEQENLRSLILDFLSEEINEEDPLDKCDIEYFYSFYFDVWNLYVNREKFVDIYEFAFKLFDYDYILKLCAYLNLETKLYEKQNDLPPQFHEIFLFINSLKIMYFLLKNTKMLFNQIHNETFEFDFTICIILYLIYNSKKHMDNYDTWLIGKTSTKTSIKFISQICLNFCYFQIFKNTDCEFVLFFNEEVFKNPLYNQFLMNSWKEEKLFKSMFNDNYYFSKFCYEIKIDSNFNSGQSINFLINYITLLNQRNRYDLIPFNFNIFVNILNHQDNKIQSFKYFLKLFQTMVYEIYDKCYEFLIKDEVLYSHKQSILFNEKNNHFQNFEIEFYKNLFILKYVLHSQESVGFFKLFVEAINQLIDINYKFTQDKIYDKSNVFLTNFNILLRFENFSILTSINLHWSKIINKINFTKISSNDIESLEQKFNYKNNKVDMVTEINFVDCSFNDPNLRNMLLSLVERKKNRLSVNLRFKSEEFLKNMNEFFQELIKKIDISTIKDYPFFKFETNYAKVLFSFNRKSLYLLNTSKKIEAFNTFIKSYEILSQIPFEYLYTDFKLIGMSFTPDNVIINILKSFKEYIIFDYAITSKDLSKYLSLLEHHNINYKVLQKVINFDRIFQNKCKKLELHIFKNRNIQYPVSLKKLRADNLVIQYFINGNNNYTIEEKFYMDLYEKKQNWTINIYYHNQIDLDLFYEHPSLDNILLLKIYSTDSSGNFHSQRLFEKKLKSRFTFYGEFSLEEKNNYLMIFKTNFFKKIRKFNIMQLLDRFLAYKKLQINQYYLELINI